MNFKIPGFDRGGLNAKGGFAAGGGGISAGHNSGFRGWKHNRLSKELIKLLTNTKYH